MIGENLQSFELVFYLDLLMAVKDIYLSIMMSSTVSPHILLKPIQLIKPIKNVRDVLVFSQIRKSFISVTGIFKYHSDFVNILFQPCILTYISLLNTSGGPN